MPFQRPKLTDLVERAEREFDARIPGADSRLRRSVLGVLARVVAGAAHGLYGFQAWIARQVFPDTAEASNLERWATIWGIERKSATFASGTVSVTGSGSPTVLAGEVLQRSDGVEFTVDEETQLAGGAASIPITARRSGEAANTDTGTTLAFASPVEGVDSEATVEAPGIEGGADAESDEDLLSRLLARIQKAPHGGAAHDYVAWAREVAGVTRAWALPQHFGAGTVGVTFVTDDDPGGLIPDGAKVSEVQDKIDLERPVTADATVFAPTPVDLNPQLSIVPDTSAVRAAVEAQLTDLLRREAEPGGTLLLSHVREAISLAAGETDHQVQQLAGVAPADVTVAATEILRLGTVTWA